MHRTATSVAARLTGDSKVPRDEHSRGATVVSSADLFAEYQPRIRRYILSMVHDPTEADDLTQEVFLQAHRKLGSLRDPDAVASWLYRIATHACYDRFRKWSRQPGSDPLDSNGSISGNAVGADTDEPRLDRVIERAEMTTCVRGYLEELSDEYRQVILLHDMEGLTNPEIAGMLDVSLDAIKIRLHRRDASCKPPLGRTAASPTTRTVSSSANQLRRVCRDLTHLRHTRRWCIPRPRAVVLKGNSVTTTGGAAG